MIMLITGGRVCGKSSFAEQMLSLYPGERCYIATMQVADAESEKRVQRHREQRAHLNMITLECPRNIGSCQIPKDGTVLLEDLPNLLANEMFGGGHPEHILSDIQKMANRSRHLFIVTNEVFSDGIAYPEETTLYMKTLSQLNADIAEMADVAVELVYSIPIVLKGHLKEQTICRKEFVR